MTQPGPSGANLGSLAGTTGRKMVSSVGAARLVELALQLPDATFTPTQRRAALERFKIFDNSTEAPESGPA